MNDWWVVAFSNGSTLELKPQNNGTIELNIMDNWITIHEELPDNTKVNRGVFSCFGVVAILPGEFYESEMKKVQEEKGEESVN